MPIEALLKGLDAIESRLKAMSEKTDGELATLGKVSAYTKAALEKLGTDQRELADRLTQLEQKGVMRAEGDRPDDSWGAHFCKSEQSRPSHAARCRKPVSR